MAKKKNVTRLKQFEQRSIFAPAVIQDIHDQLGENFFLTRLACDLATSLGCHPSAVAHHISNVFADVVFHDLQLHLREDS